MPNVVLVLCFALYAAPAFGASSPQSEALELDLSSLDIETFCMKESKGLEGMWRRECRSTEEDCLATLRGLGPEKAESLKACEESGEGQSFCALLLCVAPETESAESARIVFPNLVPER